MLGTCQPLSHRRSDLIAVVNHHLPCPFSTSRHFASPPVAVLDPRMGIRGPQEFNEAQQWNSFGVIVPSARATACRSITLVGTTHLSEAWGHPVAESLTPSCSQMVWIFAKPWFDAAVRRCR